MSEAVSEILRGKTLCLVGGGRRVDRSLLKNSEIVVGIHHHYIFADAIYTRAHEPPASGLLFAGVDINSPAIEAWREWSTAHGSPLIYFDTNIYRGRAWHGAAFEWCNDFTSSLDTMPLTGIMAVAHLLRFPISQLSLTGFDFYADRINRIPARRDSHDLLVQAHWLLQLLFKEE